MGMFKDSEGRPWAVAINTTVIKRVRLMAGVDINGLLDDKFEKLNALHRDVVLFVDVLYAVCKDEADRRSLTDEDFGRAMFGDALHHADVAFCEALADFFSDPRMRGALRRVIAAGAEVRDRLLERLDRETATIDVDSAVRRLIGSPGDSPASSASTPAPSPSGN
jgi:hypothetical protein